MTFCEMPFCTIAQETETPSSTPLFCLLVLTGNPHTHINTHHERENKRHGELEREKRELKLSLCDYVTEGNLQFHEHKTTFRIM